MTSNLSIDRATELALCLLVEAKSNAELDRIRRLFFGKNGSYDRAKIVLYREEHMDDAYIDSILFELLKIVDGVKEGTKSEAAELRTALKKVEPGNHAQAEESKDDTREDLLFIS